MLGCPAVERGRTRESFRLEEDTLRVTVRIEAVERDAVGQLDLTVERAVETAELKSVHGGPQRRDVHALAADGRRLDDIVTLGHDRGPLVGVLERGRYDPTLLCIEVRDADQPER